MLSPSSRTMEIAMRIHFFLFIMIFITSICKSIPEMPETIESIVYSGVNYNKIFDQTILLKKNSHLAQDEKKINSLLVQQFQQRKKMAMYKAYGQPIISLALPLSITCALLRLTNNKEASALLQFTLIAYAANTIQQLFRVGAYFWSDPQSPLDKYEILYTEQKRFLSSTLQQTIQDRFASARKEQSELNKTLTFLQMALNLPRTSIHPAVPTEEQFLSLRTQYEPALNAILETKLFNHCFRTSDKQAPINTPKTVLYFQGPVGCGKTYTAQQCARLLKLPLIEIKASSNLNDLLGSEEHPGSFLEAITQLETPRNAIIFIDEADLMLNTSNTTLQAFLRLLEPNTTHLYSPYLREKIDISHYCFILAGNTPITDPALNSRLTTISFTTLTQQYKAQMIKDIIQQEALLMLHRSVSLSSDVLEKLNKESISARELRLAVFDYMHQQAYKNAILRA